MDFMIKKILGEFLKKSIRFNDYSSYQHHLVDSGVEEMPESMKNLR